MDIVGVGVTKEYEYRKRCLKEKGCECAVCGSSEDILVHHKDGDRSNNSLENLVPLCEMHHRHVHAGYDTTPDDWVEALGKTPRSPEQETTTIEVSDETWRELNQQKNRGDTFDDVIRELIESNQETAKA